jgi:hypothetical protein
MNELSHYRAIAETRQLIREGFGIQSAAALAAKLTGHRDPVQLALAAAQAELTCATTRAVLAQAALRRRGITSLMESDDED